MCEDLNGFSTLDLVLPFLAVVQSPEANGLLTEAALKSLQAFLSQRLIGMYAQLENPKEEWMYLIISSLLCCVCFVLFLGGGGEGGQRILFVFKFLCMLSAIEQRF